MRAEIDWRKNRMTALQHNIKAFIRKGENQYVAECLEIAVVTQGSTLDETIANLREAVALHLENENLAEFGLAPNPTLLLTMELEPSNA
jgi:predicted RNase H-like HicB family nuclease